MHYSERLRRASSGEARLRASDIYQVQIMWFAYLRLYFQSGRTNKTPWKEILIGISQWSGFVGGQDFICYFSFACPKENGTTNTALPIEALRVVGRTSAFAIGYGRHCPRCWPPCHRTCLGLRRAVRGRPPATPDNEELINGIIRHFMTTC